MESESDRSKNSRHDAQMLASFTDFSSRASIHGVQYLGEKHRHWTERLFWFVVLALSAFACSMFLLKFHDKWQHSPIIVSFAEKSTPVWQIPFPAVTICSETKVNTKIVNFTDAFHQLMSTKDDNLTLTEEELKSMEALAQICDEHLLNKKIINSSLQETELMPLLKKMAPNLTRTTVMCRWRNKMVNCTNFFKGFKYFTVKMKIQSTYFIFKKK